MADTLSIATWNINSVRFRQAIVEKFLTEMAPDILCLQETKAVDDVFPRDLFQRLGYKHIGAPRTADAPWRGDRVQNSDFRRPAP